MLNRRKLSLTPNSPGSWCRLALPLLMLLATLAPLRAQTPGLLRTPAIDRDEARRMIPEPERTAELPADRLAASPRDQRRRLSELRQALTPQLRAEAAMRIQALEGYLDYDETDQIIYGPGRTRIKYGDFSLEADRVLLDSRLQEVQAEGNVVMELRGETLFADSIRYNFAESEGVAFNVRGEHAPVYFRNEKRVETPENATPQFQMLSKHESLFRDTDVTTCDFTVPHYYVEGKEVVLFPNDRIFLRGATFHLMGMPVMYLPAYSRSLNESSPWYLRLGYSSRTGGRMRLGYSYKHQTQEPSFDDDDEMETRSEGRADVYLDYLSKLGPGLGFDYRYAFEYNRHVGNLSIYGLRDGEREVVGATAPSPPGSSPDMFNEYERWRFLWQHRSEVTDDLTLLFNIDEFSDPDVFYDALDFFNEEQRDRQIMRRSRVALTLVQEAYVLRMMADVKDRIGLNRLNDFSSPGDNNRDFDLDPYQTLEDADAEGISADRWGRASAKLPQVDAATRWLPFSPKSWFYQTELHLYNSLDKGINVVNENDDAYVQGAEFYQSVMRQWKLSDRYTLMGKLGLGVGGADRDHDFGLDVNGPFPRQIDGLMFVDPQTFLTGQDERSLDNLNNAYAYGDTEWQLNGRFSDSLSGWLRWKYRATTDDFIGDWYSKLGSLTVREDLFNYKLRQNWLEGRLDYHLLRPLLAAYMAGGINLESGGDIYPHEPLAYWKTGVNWANLRQTLKASADVGMKRRQMYAPSDPREYTNTEWDFVQTLAYSPIHQRWYAMLRNRLELNTVNQSELANDNKLTFFTDQDTNGSLTMVYGRELGPKWDTELEVKYDYEISDMGRIRWTLERDMHDAVAVLQVNQERDEERTEDRKEYTETQFDVRLGLKFKLPGQEVAFGSGDSRTLRDKAREPAVAQ